RPRQGLGGSRSASQQPRGGRMGAEPAPGDTEEASDSGISCEEAPSEAGAGSGLEPGLDPASLRKERIVMLFLGHWKKSTYTPALKAAAFRTLEARRAGSR
ncbi:espin-like protein, partial [Nannospalax galili]|uniref:espin-like protein n=1 Tax=Nannospalax galili TaxID=1026970 RepID=UPI000819EB56